MRNNNQDVKNKDFTYSLKVNRSSELLEFLLTKLNTSRNNVKSLLTNRQILVNGSLVTQYNFMLAKDDEIKISKRPIPREGNQRQAKPKAKKFYTFNIVYEDDDFIAIDKPYGLLSVESDKERDETAFNYVFNYLQNKNKVLRPYILHRIDKETSGVLVFAKNPKIHSMMKLRWNELVKTREYYALVEGNVETKSDTITSYLLKNQNDLMYSSKDPSGEYAITNYKVVKQNSNYSLLRVNIETGRKNQIRVHMQDIGHPIVGDDKYGHTKNPLKRLGLHASKLEFVHPITKEIIEISAPVPNIFSGVFK